MGARSRSLDLALGRVRSLDLALGRVRSLDLALQHCAAESYPPHSDPDRSEDGGEDASQGEGFDS